MVGNKKVTVPFFLKFDYANRGSDKQIESHAP